MNLSLLTDFYELTMAGGYLKNGRENRTACFDMFFRKVPDRGGFGIMAGLEQLVDELEHLSFFHDDIDYLRSLSLFDEAFLQYLSNFRFSCDVWAVPEGTPIFPMEPIVTVVGPVAQAQLIETLLLITINYQSLVATKANRIVRATQGRPVHEYGARRAHGASAAVYGARAAYIAGCAGTSCTLAGKRFGIPVTGTMAHSWVQNFDTELEAFEAYARQFPQNCVLLVDTYNTLQSGVPNAIKAFDSVVVPAGFRPRAIRIDSGDITYLSKKARRMLDEAGYPDCEIIASNSVDEYIIRDLFIEGARVDMFGVGERLITASSDPVFGGVYKLSALADETGTLQPRIKLSDNVSKVTIPCRKQVWRLFDRHTGKALADVVTKFDEVVDDRGDYEIFDPDHTWKRKTVTDFIARPMLHPVMQDGKCVYGRPSIEEIRAYAAEQNATLWDEVCRLENPHAYYVDLSAPLWEERDRLLKKHAL